VALLITLFVSVTVAAGQRPAPAQPLPPPAFEEHVDVVGATPLPGFDVPADQVPAPVQTATSQELEASGALDVSDFLKRRTNAVHVNELQGNPFQADVNYRGYTASPLLGTPQGLSVYMDGVRMNQPFGEVVSWDLIPRLAIASSTLMPGSNPLFGLNTLGGALVLHTKDGHTARGTTVQTQIGSHARRSVEFQHGGATATGTLNWFLAGNLFAEDGWRDESPTDVRQLFAKAAWQRGRTGVTLSVAQAANSLTGNGLQETRLLERDYRSVYTRPDVTDNRSTWFNATLRRVQSERLAFSGNAYYRYIRSTTVNGDVNEASLDQNVYQPTASERAALAAAGHTDVPAGGADAANTPFPFWRCLANVLLNDEPGVQCNGLINHTATRQHNAGLSGQAIWQHAQGFAKHQVTAGAAFDRSSVGFAQSTEIGYLDPQRHIVGTGAFADGVTGGDVDGEPFDTRVNLDGFQRTWSLFAADTVTLSNAWHLSLSGRYNHTGLNNRDRIDPGGGDRSLDGDHAFARFNPSAGITFNPTSAITAYAGYGEGSRAATSVELGCANPEQPCKLPNAMAGDPPLRQVVTRTIEAGVRGRIRSRTQWNAGLFRAGNSDDILFVASTDTGFGYFKNFGRTRREGFEAGIRSQAGPLTVGAGYNALRATFESYDTLNGSGNSSNEDAERGAPGLESTIAIVPGDRMPLVPQHTLKVYGELRATKALSLDVDVMAASSSLARGNENGAHDPDGVYYLGPGESPGYTVVDVGAQYRLHPRIELFLQLSNVLNRRYYTAAQLGPTALTDTAAFVARPFAPIQGEYPVRQSTFFAPGAPRTALAGARITF
jgi:outer membrane receptor protein involved in Fe transport